MQGNKVKRILEIDALRGVAIVLMIIYHFMFDLNFFGLMKIDLSDIMIVLFQRFIAVLFVGLVGISLVLNELNNKRGYLTNLWRGFKLTNIAILITAATWLYPRDGFITFGIIHMIALSTFIAPLFFRLKKWNLVVGVVLIIGGIWLNLQQTDSKLLFWLGLIYPGYEALDYYPLLPWFGVVLIGIALGQMIYPDGQSRIKNIKLLEQLAILGKNSLVIYLLHQVLLVGIILIYLAVK
ncbi:Uncharacterised protein [Candidatus Bilamarchaeum dharawalense]|uniref:Heparan-alpha-glucosaminide N-acetyltransferase catalytic domain-containing protein n=1 Tax=Candidatus Bilamarchaeum dharawalense TaxID=2885759 RepID=A0A5E4LKS4_9ARCH|nr:Uncharacterised protein [Candidatus Bilamarchaeum dharawalense]